MSTAAQVSANRANATHSTGPRTQEGKAAVAKNATTHGLASHTVLSYESAEQFNELIETIADDFQPRTETEYYLVRQMAQARWRIYRIDRLINATLDSLIGAADTDCPDVRLAQSMAQLGGDPISKLQRYHSDAERSFYKAKRELENCQKTAPKGGNGPKPIRIDAPIEPLPRPPQSKPNPASPPPQPAVSTATSAPSPSAPASQRNPSKPPTDL